MESGMVKNKWSDSILRVIKDFFDKELSEFILKKEISHDPFWSIKFEKEGIKVEIKGDIGFSVDVYIFDSKFELWQYDRSVNDRMRTNEENVLYQLEVLNQFIHSL